MTSSAVATATATASTATATASTATAAARVVAGTYEDPNLQQSVGPAGVSAVNSRNVAERLMKTATDDIKKLSSRGTLRCCNCGLAVDETLKLPVRDPNDPISPCVLGQPGRDYVRVPLDYDHQRNPNFEYSDYIACTPPCALRFMYDNPNILLSHVPHRFAMMMWLRHRVDEPVNAAPPADTLNYVYRWRPLHSDEKTTPHRPMSSDVGLTARSFYWLLATANLIGYKQEGPKFCPPMEAEYTALANRDHRFTKYYFPELPGQSGPPQIGAKLPAHLPPGGIRLDGTPDADTDYDFATDTVHLVTTVTQPNPNQNPSSAAVL